MTKLSNRHADTVRYIGHKSSIRIQQLDESTKKIMDSKGRIYTAIKVRHPERAENWHLFKGMECIAGKSEEKYYTFEQLIQKVAEENRTKVINKIRFRAQAAGQRIRNAVCKEEHRHPERNNNLPLPVK